MRCTNYGRARGHDIIVCLHCSICPSFLFSMLFTTCNKCPNTDLGMCGRAPVHVTGVTRCLCTRSIIPTWTGWPLSSLNCATAASFLGYGWRALAPHPAPCRCGAMPRRQCGQGGSGVWMSSKARVDLLKLCRTTREFVHPKHLLLGFITNNQLFIAHI